MNTEVDWGCRERRGAQAFTRAECLLVLLTLGLLTAISIPALASQRNRSDQTTCTANLRRLSQAFLSWANDHGDLFSFRVFDRGGTYARDTAYIHFAAVSNYLDSPRFLVCPATLRLPVQRFDKLRNPNVSYGLGAHAWVGKNWEILLADRDIEGGEIESCSVLGSIRVVGFPGISGVPAAYAASWSSTNHMNSGNIARADGSVATVDSFGLRSLMSMAGSESLPAGHVYLPSRNIHIITP